MSSCSSTSEWSRSGRIRTRFALDEYGKPITCFCGHYLRVQTSKTSTNPGRKFMSCPDRQLTKCDYFVWCDERVIENTPEYLKGVMDELVSVKCELISAKRDCLRFKRISIWSLIVTVMVIVMAYVVPLTACY